MLFHSADCAVNVEFGHLLTRVICVCTQFRSVIVYMRVGSVQ